MATILIVEDDAFIRMVAGEMLGDWGHDIIEVEKTTDALHVLRSDRLIDLLFTDIRIHDLVDGGFEIARQGVLSQPDLRVLYTSGSTLTETFADAFVGGGRFLQKPYSPEDLQASVEGALAR